MVQIEQVTKSFGKSVVAVNDVSLHIEEGEFFALLGPSGCGKTTLLRMIAGFENPNAGRIQVNGLDMVGVDPNKRPVNMVFQSYAVFPHMTVGQNVNYGLKVAGVAKSQAAPLVAEALALVKLDGYEDRMPDQLSGGQRQRVALARALVKKPRVLLLDEPLSALDAKLREAMQIELVRLQKSVGITFIMVTHAQDEALSVADRIAVMDHGKVQQVATPQDLYERPANRFTADFIGKINLFEANFVGVQGDRVIVDAQGIGQVVVPHAAPVDKQVTLAVRPEKLRLTKLEPSGDLAKIRSRITDLVYYGNNSHVYLKSEQGLEFAVDVQNEEKTTNETLLIGDEMWASWKGSDTLLLNN